MCVISNSDLQRMFKQLPEPKRVN